MKGNNAVQSTGRMGFWRSLRGRLILLALIAFVPLFGLAVYQAIEARQQALAGARATVQHMAKNAESELTAHIQSARQLVHAMAASPALRGNDFAACSALLGAQLKLGQRYAGFALAGRDGKQLCNADPAAAAPANYSNRDYFRRVLETRQPAIGKPVIGRATKRALLPVAQPLLDAGGEVLRVLLAGLDLERVGANISDASPAANLVVVMSDEEGRVLYRWPDNEKWFGQLDPEAPITQALRAKRPGEAFETVGLEGVTRIFAFAQSREHPEGSLVIRVGAARAALTAAADRELAIALAVLIVIAGLILFAVIAVAEKFVRGPVAALARTAGRLAEGDLSVRAPESEFRGELAWLAAGFNRMAAALQTQMGRAESVVEAAPDPIVIVDREGRIAIVNARTEEAFGYSRAELLGQPVELLIPERLHAAHVTHRASYQENPRARAMGAGRDLFARRKDGGEFAVDVSLSPLVTPKGTLIISTVRDVTERKQTEAKVRRLNRVYAVLSGINSLIVRVGDRQVLFDEACRIAVEHGNFGLAWIGLFDPATLDVTPVAWTGLGWDEFDRTKSSARADMPLGQGVVGRAIREREPVFDNDISASPGVAGKRRQEALRLGYCSLIALPLFAEDAVAGILALFVKERDFFDTEEVKLLTELAGDISFALEHMAKQQKLEKLSRIRLISGEINAAIVRIENRDALLRETCRIATERGGFELTWIGALDSEGQEVKPIAWAGFSPETAHAVSWASITAAKGTLGEAMRTRKPAVRNDIEAELPAGKLRQEALKKGCLSTVCLPLVADDNVVALIVLFATGRGFFDADELALLNEVAADVSFALQSISRREKLEYLSYYDALTGLPNRQLFVDRLTHQMRARSGEQRMIALVLLDLDRFRNVNETLGRHGGDELLKLTARRLERVFHGGDYLAHIGADNFGAVIRGVRDAPEVAHVVQSQVLACFTEPFMVNGSELRVEARTGIALFPGDGSDADTLFKNAEAALRNAKASGERYLFYAPPMNARVAEQLKIENQLRVAVLEEQFVLHYQPRIEFATGRICGLEALIRWMHPGRGLVPPAEFISILEETGLILEAGRWALKRAALDHAAWRAAGLKPPRIAVNVSAIQLRREEFVENVRAAVSDAGDSRERIDIEITESMLMHDIEGNIVKLKAVRAMGMQVALDDFGTGYSSLSYLARLPIDSLKIDRSFVSQMERVSEQRAIVSTVISLARALHLKVVAEGVETEEQAKLLRQLGCDEAQGYLFGRPMPWDKVEGLIG